MSLQLNVVFSSGGMNGMLEDEDYQSVDMVVPFILVFADKATKYVKNKELTKVNSLYSELAVGTHGRC